MKFTAIDHITINMLEVEKSFDFYGNVLGLEKVNEVDLVDHVLHLYQLPGTKLELIEYRDEQKVIQAGNTDIGVYRHFALCADDLKEVEEKCDEAGYGINLRPTFVEGLGKTVMLIKDPNGVEIEIVQN